MPARHFLFLLLAALPLTAQTITGRSVPELAVYDDAVRSVLQKWAIPGASVAITDQGRLVYARGFGFADRERALPVQPTSIFRLASISKTLTGMTILKLIEEGRLTLDSRLLDLLPNLTPVPGTTLDPRIRQITVRQLLQHTAGWAREIPDDFVLQFTAAARALNVDRSTITPEQLCRYAISQRLDFDPGTRYYYSQAGYLLLGRIIERVTGQRYEQAVREKLLTPAGVTSLKLGRSLFAQKEPEEVRYYDYPGRAPLTTAPTVPGAVAPYEAPYGGFWVEQAEAYGGWIGNAIDLMRYVNALEGRRGPALLNTASLSTIIQRPSVTPTGEFVGLTWRITPITGGQHWWHSGGATGTRNLLTRRQNNRNWVVLMNMRPQDENSILTDLFTAFANAESRVTAWPTHDLFADFSGPQISTDLPSLTFDHLQGQPNLPPTQTLQVLATPATPVNFTIAPPAAAWLKLDRLVATTPAALRVSVDPAGLTPGTYSTTFTLTAPQSANGTRTVPVNLRITAPTLLNALRSAANLAEVAEAAPFSRLLAQTPIDLTQQPELTIGGLPAVILDWQSRQVDFLVPEGVSPGDTEVALLPALNAPPITARLRVVEVSPALFLPRLNGPRPTLTRLSAPETTQEVFDCTLEACTPIAINLGAEDDLVSLRLPLTGTRSQTTPEAYTVTIGDLPAPVTAFESGPDGIDWLTVTLPRELLGRGEATLTITLNEKTTEPLRLRIE